MIHFELMLLGENDIIFLKEGEDDTLGLILYHIETSTR